MFLEHVLKHIWENKRFFRNTHVLQLFEIFLYSFSLNIVVNLKKKKLKNTENIAGKYLKFSPISTGFKG